MSEITLGKEITTLRIMLKIQNGNIPQKISIALNGLKGKDKYCYRF